ncbi:MAG: hypothetical protein A2057_14400 [Ignavibacteria bacterium GWA2_35_9]|nr:MAG: hypothetical protein A2057_14400 [Ignavibacteria bacterium GWA2_35_9]
MSATKKLASYFAPALIAVLIFISNFLDTEIFKFGENNFAVWFVISVFCFALGWYMNKSYDWHLGGKIIFALAIATSFVSIFLVTFFKEYFSASSLVAENIILYTLRDIMLGTMAFFGMAMGEIFSLQKELLEVKSKLNIFEEYIKSAKDEAALTVLEAKVKAEKIVNDASAIAKNTLLKKERIEKELKEFIQIERELIKKYEEK